MEVWLKENQPDNRRAIRPSDYMLSWLFPGVWWLARGVIGPGLAMAILSTLYYLALYAIFSLVSADLGFWPWMMGLNHVPGLIALCLTRHVLRSRWRDEGRAEHTKPDDRFQRISGAVFLIFILVVMAVEWWSMHRSGQNYRDYMLLQEILR